MTTHALTWEDHDDQGYGDGLDQTWECTCGKSFTINDVAEAFDHGQETAGDAKPRRRPYVVTGLSGGLIQWWMTAPGVGKPEVDHLDFDREGEDDDERAEWVEYAREVVARMRSYGLNADETEAAVDEMAEGREEDE